MKPHQLGIIIAVASIVLLGLLIFLKVQTDRQNEQACTIACGEGHSTDFCPFHQDNTTSWIVILAAVFAAFTGGIGFYLSFSKPEKIITEKEYDLSSLPEDEQNIFLYIKKHKEGVYQSTLTKEFNLSKVQATRLLDKFEGMDLVERKRRGLSNIIKIK